MPYFSISAISFSPSSGRLPRFAITQRPSLVCAMVGCGDTLSRACRQVWRKIGARRMTQVIRSTSVHLETASCTAQDTCWPLPVRWRYMSAARIAMLSCSPAT